MWTRKGICAIQNVAWYFYLYYHVEKLSGSYPRISNMFKGNKEAMATGNVNSPDKLNRIVEGTSIEGEIISEGNIRIDGKVKGNLSGEVISILSSGSVDGSISGTSVNVDGNVSGKVSVQDLAVNANGKVSADVTYQSIATEKGARIDGKLKSK